MMLQNILRVVGIAMAVLLLTTLSASAATVEYQFHPVMGTPILQGWGGGTNFGGAWSINGPDPVALTIIEATTTPSGEVLYYIDHGGLGNAQYYTFECRAVAKITDYTDASERALFTLEYATGRATYGAVITAGMAKTADGKVKVGFMGEDGEWIGSTYTTPEVESDFVELVMRKTADANSGPVYLYLDGVDTGVSVLCDDPAFQYIGTTTIQNFRFGITYGTSGGVPTGTVDVIGASCGNKGDSAPLICTAGYLQSDVNWDCKVNMLDFAILASGWLDCNLSDQEDCWN